MQAAVIRGASGAGADVFDLGLVGTEMVYFAVGSLDLDGGIAVTASHNPREYTGMKIVRRGALPVGGDSGLLEVRDRAMSPADTSRSLVAGHVQEYDIWPTYVDRVLSFVDLSAIKPLRVVIDAANGMAGAMLPTVLDRLPVDAVRCFFDPDGSFPNHQPNPLLAENREFIVSETLEESADLGVAFDGDADRCFFVDDTGEFVPGDFVTALFAAGEVSGHYYFRDFTQADSGVIPFLLMLELISKRGEPLSKILAPLRERYFITGEINTPVSDVALKLQELKERYAPEARISHLDGISVDGDGWHFNVRPSNTEPLLRLNLEARTREVMERRRDEVLQLIRSR